jgi:hypothetical protein
VTAPKTKRQDPGFSQLGLWIRSGVLRDLQRAAAAEGRPQRELVEEALVEYLKRARDGSGKAAPA